MNIHRSMLLQVIYKVISSVLVSLLQIVIPGKVAISFLTLSNKESYPRITVLKENKIFPVECSHTQKQLIIGEILYLK